MREHGADALLPDSNCNRKKYGWSHPDARPSLARLFSLDSLNKVFY